MRTGGIVGLHKKQLMVIKSGVSLRLIFIPQTIHKFEWKLINPLPFDFLPLTLQPFASQG
jgi:hypothetical protein